MLFFVDFMFYYYFSQQNILNLKIMTNKILCPVSIKSNRKSFKILRSTTLCLLLSVVCPQLSAQTAREEIKQLPRLSGSNYLAYREPVKPLTATPKGYEPFYLTHYARHGSRWLIAPGDYDNPLKTLRNASADHKLTIQGQKVLSDLEEFYKTTRNRLGELTTVGARQHHGIGKRMTRNFPEIFKGTPEVDARSTVVIRCILSMTAECEELMAYNPQTKINNDVSESYQYYLNRRWDGEVRRQGNSRVRGEEVHKARMKYTHPERFCSIIFNDMQYVKDSLNGGGAFMNQMFDVATNMQSHDTNISFIELFTNDELYDLWKIRNIDWYLGYGPAPQTGGVMPYSQSALLRNIIETADTVVDKKNWNGATLRFGHEVCVMPLACLLELDSCGRQVHDLEKLDEQWVNYRIYPMASNIQLVFYRPIKGKEGDLLLKVLLNEHEATLPIHTDSFPYYRWKDFRDYYVKKLDDFETKYPSETKQ